MTDPAQPEYLGRQDDLPRTLSSVEPFATLRGDDVSKHSANPYASRQLSSHYDHPLWQHASHVDTGFFGSVDSVEQLHRTFSRPGKSRVRLIPGTEGKQGKSTLPVLTVVTLASPFNVSMKFETSSNPMIELFGSESGIKRRELGVAFKDLRVIGIGAAALCQETFGSSLNPFNYVRGIRRALRPATRDILTGFEGVVRPGEMLLVLGRPGSGCSTLLKVLANQRQDYHSIGGDVWYDSLTPEQIEQRYRGDVHYCPEDDVHFPPLTVDQTLRFAARTRTPHTTIHQVPHETRVSHVVDALETAFGLKHVKDTLVGDASIRGVSGGEKKRVSISEALASRSLLYCWDNPTRGLDASTALEFVQALRIATDIGRASTIAAIYQAGEQLYRDFDKVCVIYEGRQVYFGRADMARQYFIDMGYEPANRQTTADFLVAVTDSHGRIIRKGYESRVPRTAAEFADYFCNSEFARANHEDTEAYRQDFVGKRDRESRYEQSFQREHARRSIKKSPFIASIGLQMRVLMRRRVQIIRGDSAAQVIQLVSSLLQAVVVGTVYLRLDDDTNSFFSRAGVLFFSLLFVAMASMAEIPALFAQRPIVYRQSRAAMYHPFVEALAHTMVDVPITLVNQIVFGVPLYFIVGLQQSAGQFFVFLLITFTVTLAMKAWFRAVAMAFKSPAPATAVAGVSILLLSLYAGYTVPRPYMTRALRWINSINPLGYGLEALLGNEFRTIDARCSTLVPQGPGYEGISVENQACMTVGSTPGSRTVSGLRYVRLVYEYSYSHLWRNFGAICAFTTGLVGILLLLTEVNQGLSSGRRVSVLFKRGSESPVSEATETEFDEEKGSTNSGAVIASACETDVEELKNAATRVHSTFSFHHLNYVVPIGKGETRQLLEDVSGCVLPGKLTALMGESGAGKTTLLNVLAERTTSGFITGQRYMNGHRLPSDFQAHTAYCQQEDTHLPTATVREALLFSANLRQPQSVSLEEKKAYVERVLKMCGLAAYADAIVGSLGVEQRKRTTIAVELVAKPSLIFLDEPTSGLDSQSAWAITSFLRDLADSGHAIVCTIHQPSAELFQMFDQLLLLKKGGQTVYFGDIGSKSAVVIDYFEHNGARKCSDDENPAEYILEAIGAGATASTDIDWRAAWNRSPEADQVQGELERIHTEGRRKTPVQRRLESEYPTSWWYQMTLLLKRDAEAHWRDPVYLLAKLALNIAGGLIIGFAFFKVERTIQGLQNQLFAVFMTTILGNPLSYQLHVPFIDMRNIYEIRERHSRMYSWTALTTSQILIEIPWNILGSSLYFPCWYWTVGFPTDRAGFTFLITGILFPLYYTTMAQAVAAMAPNAEIAGLLFCTLISFVLTFNGVFQPYSQLGWWQWMYYLSPYTYVIEALLGQALGHQPIQCSPVELVTIEPPSGQSCAAYMGPYISSVGGYTTNPDATRACQYCSFSTTDAFLETSLNIFYDNHWRDLGIFAVFIVFNVAAIYLFTYIFRIRKGT